MSISVIIVNYNSGKLLADCIERLNDQTVSPERVYIVDNSSDDQSELICADLEIIEVDRMPVNIGFAAGNNKVLFKCKTRFIAVLNPDAFPEPQWLENLLKAAIRYPDSAAFGSKQLCYGDPDILDGVGDIYHVSGLVWRDRHGMRMEPQDDIPKEIFSPCAAAAMYRRQILVDVGGFDEDYFCYIEDVDVGFRLRLAGYKSMYVPNAVVQHVGSATTGGKESAFSTYYCHRNIVWTYVKNMPGMLFWFLLPLHLLINFIAIVQFSLRGKYRLITKSKIDAVKGLKTMWKKRKSIQRHNAVSVRDILRVLDYRFLPGK